MRNEKKEILACDKSAKADLRSAQVVPRCVKKVDPMKGTFPLIHDFDDQYC